MSFSLVGLGPDSGVSWTLPRLVGQARAAELLMLAEPIPADRALSLGLVTSVVPGRRVQRERARPGPAARGRPDPVLRGDQGVPAVFGLPQPGRRPGRGGGTAGPARPHGRPPSCHDGLRPQGEAPLPGPLAGYGQAIVTGPATPAAGRVSGQCVGEVPPLGAKRTGGSRGSPPPGQHSAAGGSEGGPPGQHSAAGGSRGVRPPQASTAQRGFRGSPRPNTNVPRRIRECAARSPPRPPPGSPSGPWASGARAGRGLVHEAVPGRRGRS